MFTWNDRALVIWIGEKKKNILITVIWSKKVHEDDILFSNWLFRALPVVQSRDAQNKVGFSVLFFFLQWRPTDFNFYLRIINDEVPMYYIFKFNSKEVELDGFITFQMIKIVIDAKLY